MTGAKLHPHRKFCEAEDALLQRLVQSEIGQNWIFIASRLPGRNVRQCRDRWLNYLSPDLTSAPWTAQEELLLEQKCLEFGTRWQLIQPFFPNRSKNQIKHQWITKCRIAAAAQIDGPVASVQVKVPPSPPTQKDVAASSRNGSEIVEDLFDLNDQSGAGFDFWDGTLEL
jgi:hypothetical protein